MGNLERKFNFKALRVKQLKHLYLIRSNIRSNMPIPRNLERHKRILECWKKDMTIDQATSYLSYLNEKRSTVGYYYGKFNKAKKRGELQKYLPEELSRPDKIPPRYSNPSPIKQSDSEDNLAKYEEVFMDLIFFDKFQSSVLKEDHQKAYYVYQTWVISKNWENMLRKTGIKETQKVLDLMAIRTPDHNPELEKQISENLMNVKKLIDESMEDERTEEILPEFRIDKILGSRRKPKKEK